MFDSLQPHGPYPTRLLCPWDSPGKKTGVACHFLLQGIFQTQGLHLSLLCLLHYRQILNLLSPWGSWVSTNTICFIILTAEFLDKNLKGSSLWRIPHWLRAPRRVVEWVLKVKVTPSCPTLCDSMDRSLPGSSVCGILQARILERVAISLSRGIFLTQESNPGLPHCRQILHGLSQNGSQSPLRTHRGHQ